jgi:hypothetical protein
MALRAVPRATPNSCCSCVSLGTGRARANRALLARVVRYLAGDCGIRQFLDIGTGLPAPGSTHELAQQVAPECAVPARSVQLGNR